MKLKFTPLIIVAVISILYGLYIFLSGQGGNLGGLVLLISFFIGAICLLLYFGFRKLFKTKIWKQVITELVLIIIAASFYYKENGRLVLHVPPHFKGYIIVVYGADKKPKLPAPGLVKADIDITVPNSGIILTSSRRTKTISVIDSSDNETKLSEAGYGIPISSDALNCGNKKYDLDVLVFGKLPLGWMYKEDTLIRNLKKELACKMLSE